MNIHIIYFDRSAEKLAFQLRDTLSAHHETLTIASGGEGGSLPYIPVALWVTGHFRTGETLVFVGGTEIAAQSVDGRRRDETTDPAVVVVDGQGKYAIPLRPGRNGEADPLAREIADILGGTAVVSADAAAAATA